MLKVSIPDSELKQLDRKIKSLNLGVKNNLKKELTRAAFRVQADAKGNILKNDTVDTGRLLNSIDVKISRMTAEIGTNVGYGEYIEYGTVNMEENPFLHPAVEKERENLKKRIIEIVEKEAIAKSKR